MDVVTRLVKSTKNAIGRDVGDTIWTLERGLNVYFQPAVQLRTGRVCANIGNLSDCADSQTVSTCEGSQDLNKLRPRIDPPRHFERTWDPLKPVMKSAGAGYSRRQKRAGLLSTTRCPW